jgi:Ca-activated chloride channel family protein
MSIPHHKSNPDRCFALLLAGIFFFVGSAGAPHLMAMVNSPEGSDASTIAISSDLVVLDLDVTDEQGHFVPGLKKEDFMVYDEKRTQNIAFFAPEEAPVSVGLVVDRSESMQRELTSTLSAVSVVAESGKQRDEMFVVDFSDTTHSDLLGKLAFTSDPRQIEEAVADVSAHGRTALYDAIAEGIFHLRPARSQKKDLVIISDGGDNASLYNSSDIVELARKLGVTIYSIGVTGDDGKQESFKSLKRLCTQTGGTCLFPRSPSEVMDAAAQIALELHQGYLVGYVPDSGSGPALRKIVVNVNPQGQQKLHIHMRRATAQAG